MKKKILSVAFVLLFLLQLLPINLVLAVNGTSDVTNTTYLVVHPTDYPTPSEASSLKITDSAGAIISPDASGNYSNIPTGAKIILDYAFGLEDGDAALGTTYDYDGDEYFTATLPEGLNFKEVGGTIVATDTSNGYNYDLATWSISGNTLKVELTNAAEDSSLHGGAANDAHMAKWGKVHIEGTFKPLNAGDNTDLQITFGSQTIHINRQPLPSKSTLEKRGSYDASKNQITWTVMVSPPASDPTMSYAGYSVEDNFSNNQTYVTNSFAVGATPIPDTDLMIDSTSNKITYTFPDSTPTTGVQTISYKTTPSTFAAENGTSADQSTYSNTVNLKRGTDFAADPASDDVSLDWISKSGVMVDTAANDPTIIKWSVAINVPGENGKSITGAQIIDSIPADLELLINPSYPVSIQFGSGAKSTVNNGTSEGEYGYGGNVLSYRFPSNQPTAGTNATLTFYTKVTTASWDTYLNNNSAISFSNSAKLSWTENTTGTNPSDSDTISTGIGSGGILSKSGGSVTNYTYSVSDPGTIHWTITVNRNKINIVNAKITDTIPANQVLLIDASHPFTVKKQGTNFETITTPASVGNFTYTDTNQYAYEFPEETLGSDTISSTYIVEYDTRLVDPSGLSSLYQNGTVGFKNSATLTRTGAAVSVTGTKNYDSQMVKKSVAKAYDYKDHTVQWQIVINRNKLPLTNAVLSDTLPSGMKLLIDAAHPVSVTALGGGDTGTFVGASGDASFTLTLPISTSDQYTLAFWTKLNDEILKTQWNGTKDFTNIAALDSNEITGSVTHTAKVSIKNPVVSKDYQYAAGSDTIHWSAVINPAQILLQRASVSDVLNASLKLDPASVRLTEVLIDAATGNVLSEIAPVDPTNYRVTLPSTANSNTLVVALPENTQAAYQLEFSTFILADDINLSNVIQLTGDVVDASGNATSNQIVVSDLYSSGGSGTNSLTIHKTDPSGNPLADSMFRLLNSNKLPIMKSGSEITKKTNAAGDAVFSNLPSWVFYVEEIDPAPGYLIPVNPFSGGTRLSGAETLNVTNSLAKAEVSFSKKGANDTPLSGGTFTLAGMDFVSNPVSKTSTAVNGVVTFSDVAPNKIGTPYTITETVAPTGHALTVATISATVEYNTAKNGLIVTLTPDSMFNAPQTGTVSFTKTGSNGDLLSGGSFTLSGTDYAHNPVNKSGYAAVNGVVTFPDVPIGDYQITELTPPDGYLLPTDTKILTAQVAYNANNTGLVTTIRSTTATNPIVTSYGNTKAEGSISFSKLDAQDASPLSGGSFTLTGKDYAGKDVSITASSVGGTVTFSGVPLGDDYTMKETTPPAGYSLTSSVLKASVKYNAGKTAVVTSVTPNQLSNARAPSSGNTVYAYAKISVVKTDEGGNKLSGAEFTLYDKKGNVVSKAISDKDGIAMFGNVIEGSGYTIKETKAPEGFGISPNSIALAITTSDSQTFTVVNQKLAEKTGNISILKKDESGKALAGAEFTLYDAEGKVVSTIVTKEDGTAVFQNVALGTYTVSETRAPSGYRGDASRVSVTVTSGDVQSLVITNKKIEEQKPTEALFGRLEIAKVNEDHHPLAGAEFTLYDQGGNVIRTAISGTDGLVIFDGLAAGKYSVKETVAPEGYRLFEEPLELQIKANGDKLSYTLKDTKLANDADVAGWSKGDDKNGGVLPKTGGIPTTVYMGIAGLSLIFVGAIVLRPKNHEKRSK